MAAGPLGPLSTSSVPGMRDTLPPMAGMEGHPAHWIDFLPGARYISPSSAPEPAVRSVGSHQDPPRTGLPGMTALKLIDIAQLTGAHLVGDGQRTVSGPASLEDADGHEISFLAEPRQADRLTSTRALAVVIGEDVDCTREDLILLRCADPKGVFNRVVEAFALPRELPLPGIHTSAVVDSGAELSHGVHVGPLCTVGQGARLEEGAVLHPRVSVGEGCTVGERTVLHPGVVLYPHVKIGADCIIHAGAVLGADGFGFEPTAEGWVKTPQGGTVVIEDWVEIGANVTIDCARFKATHIGRGVKIDNLVHIAHNCRIGEGAMLVAQSGVAGSTRIGAGVILAGQTGVAGHLEIGDGARIGAAAAVFKDVPPGEVWWGVPAGPKDEAIRRSLSSSRLERLRERLRAVEQRLAEQEETR